MGSAMLAGWQKDKKLAALFHVIEPMLDAPELAGPHTCFYRDISALPDGFIPDLVVLAVKPQMMAEVLGGAVSIAGTETSWLSIAAGLSTQKLSAMLGGETEDITRYAKYAGGYRHGNYSIIFLSGCTR